MRGTLHLVAACDVRWINRLLAPRVARSVQTRFHQLGLTADRVEQCRVVLQDYLADGSVVTRKDIFALFDGCGVNPDEQRGYSLIAQFARKGMICCPETPGGSTFVHLDHWTAGHPDRNPDDPVTTLAMMYIPGHGPVTPDDFARWTGLSLTVARKGFHHNRDLCKTALIKNREYWWSTGHEVREPDSRVHLLPGFDEFMLGYMDRTASIRPAWQGRIVPGGNGVFRPTIVVDGQVDGSWATKRSKEGNWIEASWWLAPSDVGCLDQQIESEAVRCLTFLEIPELDQLPVVHNFC